ncbi:class II aldolase/adducin family protein [Shewanella sp. ULN5]|uniref:class II aldolase/adducin family protein n=1 Tax=Shewanella sp. ULN5 TaxID=2994678 RepID=UPI00273ED94A|nr:class II aldolase/adducin family protein [Shewanella sp. ULN5]MDP5148233.1 class II aldolase/adducin family protein [Shewanella sp. ULN5]
MTQTPQAVMNAETDKPAIFEGNTHQQIRAHRKQRLITAFHLFAKLGFDEGLAGHITVRDSEHLDHFWVNPLGVSFKSMNEALLLRVDHDGNVVEGEGLLNGAAFTIHSKIHQRHPHINAVAHAHSMSGKTWSSLGELLKPITQDACAFYQDHAVFDEFSGVVLDLNEGEHIAKILSDNKALILQNHGLLTVAKTVEAAAWWFVSMERSCKAQLLAQAAGTPKVISHQAAMSAHAIVGSEEAGFYSFLTMIQEKA